MNQTDAEMKCSPGLKRFSGAFELSGAFLRGGIAGACAMLAVTIFTTGSNPVNFPRAGDVYAHFNGGLEDREAGVRRAVGLFADAFVLAEEQHVRNLLDDGIAEAMINGALQALDPHSGFLEEGLAEQILDADAASRFQIGVLMRSHEGTFLIESVVPESPGEKAGMRAGDKIVQIGDRYVANDDPDVVSKIISEAVQTAGSGGLGMRLERDGAMVDVTVVPDLADTVSAYGLGVTNGVLHVFVQRFFPGTTENVATLIDKAIDEHDVTGVVIDLRGNGGGLTSEALSLSELFLPEDRLLYSMEGRAVGTEEVRTSLPEQYPGLNVAVLTNGRTGSASEIFASALQAHKRGVVVGWTSLGKGTVQRIYPVEGGAVKVTVATYKDALNRQIDGVGVKPDISLRMPDPILRPSRYERDAALRAAQKYLGGADE
jgi:carboxyl-terminal processing protease